MLEWLHIGSTEGRYTTTFCYEYLTLAATLIRWTAPPPTILNVQSLPQGHQYVRDAEREACKTNAALVELTKPYPGRSYGARMRFILNMVVRTGNTSRGGRLHFRHRPVDSYRHPMWRTLSL